MNEYYDLLMEYTLDSENYKKWREIHGNAFGNVFHSAFDESLEAQIHLTAALIRISSRNFNGGLSILLMLEQFCFNDFDNFALSYFTGLCYEFLENEEEMNKYYDKMLEYYFDFEFIIGFHPYYRTAKFAQRKSENIKALNYYNKAFELYCDDETDAVKLQNMGQICYDIGTVYLSCQDYDKSHQFLDMSCKYSPADNPQRNYVLAILFAVEGKREEAKKIVDSLPDYLKANCQQIVSSI
jgi:tetratricopeptide (TPR) repeat protein